MEQNHSRLRATLVAGNMPVTDEALSTLSAGLSTIGHGYQIEKVISGEAKTEAQLGKVLCRVDVAFRTAVDILDADLSGTGQIDALLSDPWRGSQIPRIVEELRLLSSRIEPPLATLAQDRAIKKRQKETPAKSRDLVLPGGPRSFRDNHWQPRAWCRRPPASVHKTLRSAD